MSSCSVCEKRKNEMKWNYKSRRLNHTLCCCLLLARSSLLLWLFFVLVLYFFLFLSLSICVHTLTFTNETQSRRHHSSSLLAIMSICCQITCLCIYILKLLNIIFLSYVYDNRQMRCDICEYCYGFTWIHKQLDTYIYMCRVVDIHIYLLKWNKKTIIIIMIIIYSTIFIRAENNRTTCSTPILMQQCMIYSCMYVYAICYMVYVYTAWANIGLCVWHTRTWHNSI